MTVYYTPAHGLVWPTSSSERNEGRETRQGSPGAIQSVFLSEADIGPSSGIASTLVKLNSGSVKLRPAFPARHSTFECPQVILARSCDDRSSVCQVDWAKTVSTQRYPWQ